MVLNVFNQNFDEQYLSSVSRIILVGDLKPSARDNLPGTVSSYGSETFHFDVSSSIPLPLSKRGPSGVIFSELYWFLLGDTDLRPLLKLKNKIWVGDAFRKFAQNHSLESLISREDLIRLRKEKESEVRKENLNADISYVRSVVNEKVLRSLESLFSKKILEDEKFGNMHADLGPIYGYNLRFFEQGYHGSTKIPEGKYVDQLENLLLSLEKSPFSRRIQFIYLNPLTVNEAVLPPCHMYYHVNVVEVNGKKYIDISMTQRSADMFLGVPFNIASTVTLLYMFAETFGFKPRHFTHTLNDAHVYLGLNWSEKDYSAFDTLRRKHIKNFRNKEDLIIAGYNFLKDINNYLRSQGKDPGHLHAFEKQFKFYLENKDSFVYPTLKLKDFDIREASDINKSFRVAGLEENVRHLEEQMSKIIVEGYTVNGKKPPLIRAPLYAGFAPDFYDENTLRELYKEN